MRKLGLVALFISAFTFLFSNVAFANSITTTAPIAGITVTTAPTNISITTALTLTDQGSQIVVNDPNGVAVDDGQLSVNSNVATVGLQALKTTGVYTVNYTLLDSNSETLSGSYTFMFSAPSAIGSQSPTPTTPANQKPVNYLNSGSNAFVYTLLALAGVVLAFLIWFGKKNFGAPKRVTRK